MKRHKILNSISGVDKVFGKLCWEAENCYKNENYFAAISCLFIATEQIIKYSLSENDGNFHQSLLKAKKNKVINSNLFMALEDLRNLRNRLFHESQYTPITEFIFDGILYPPYEDETRKFIYERFSGVIFDLVNKIILNKIG